VGLEPLGLAVWVAPRSPPPRTAEVAMHADSLAHARARVRVPATSHTRAPRGSFSIHFTPTHTPSTETEDLFHDYFVTFN
jgi:hypothetical protein